MSFDTVVRKQKTNFKKNNFLSLTEGTYIIRIVDADYTAITSHWINGISVACLGSDICPVCQNNYKIMRDSPKDYRSVPGFVSLQTRYYFNVLDRSMVKVCPKCGAEIKKVGNSYPTNCTSCNELIVAEKEHPSNKIKIVSLPERDINQLATYNKSILDKEGNPIGLCNFDIMVVVTGSRNTKSTSFVPLTNSNDVVDIKEEDKNDLNNAVIKLTEKEINDLLRGVTLRDIFSARQTPQEKEDAVLGETSDKLKEEISKLF